jgi:NADH:ubiquinone oxidoreductase subunit 4 (chain M)
MSLPWLTTIGLLPLLGAVAVWLLPKHDVRTVRLVALGFSLATLLVTLLLAFRFDASQAGSYQFSERANWIPQLGVSYALGVDGIALVMVALSTVLVPVCILAAWNEITDERAGIFYGLILVLETFMVGVFAARDVFLFYVFFEASRCC